MSRSPSPSQPPGNGHALPGGCVVRAASAAPADQTAGGAGNDPRHPRPHGSDSGCRVGFRPRDQRQGRSASTHHRARSPTALIRDAVYARIADDLEELRRETWRFACEDNTACTGEEEHADIPVSYKTARQCASTPCSNGELPQISDLTAACSSDTLGSYMAANHINSSGQPWFPLSASTTLDWTKNLPAGTAAPPQATGVSIQRTISVNTSDENQLDVTYNTNSNAPVAITLNASIVPQALSWCP